MTLGHHVSSTQINIQVKQGERAARAKQIGATINTKINQGFKLRCARAATMGFSSRYEKYSSRDSVGIFSRSI